MKYDNYTTIKTGGSQAMELFAKLFAGAALFIGTLVILFGFSLLLGFPIMWLMNYVFTPGIMLTIFGVAKMTFWRAFWTNYLFGILFRSSVSVK
jgi:hypothetical protein